MAASGLRCLWGLSPLARGNLDHGVHRAAPSGPIPARAGEPSRTGGFLPRPGAYPRSRGGTAQEEDEVFGHGGLSPLARGNLNPLLDPKRIPGPIPARAGEPDNSFVTGTSYRAYPRSRGGTSIVTPKRPSTRGLSPLARGNLGQLRNAGAGVGPIPARAGEPCGNFAGLLNPRAYPRSRGGTYYGDY